VFTYTHTQKPIPHRASVACRSEGVVFDKNPNNKGFKHGHFSLKNALHQKEKSILRMDFTSSDVFSPIVGVF
jgi:hypothetical protein